MPHHLQLHDPSFCRVPERAQCLRKPRKSQRFFNPITLTSPETYNISSMMQGMDTPTPRISLSNAEIRASFLLQGLLPRSIIQFPEDPPAFRVHIGAELGKQVYLKGPSGCTWKVKLVRSCDGFIFEDGWRCFASDHSLALGDFLLFRYDGDSRFKVLVFDSTACEKDAAFLATPSVDEGNVAVEESEESEDEAENTPLVHFAKRRFEWILQKNKWGISDHSNKKKLKLSSAHLSSSSGDFVTVKQECESHSPYDSNEYNRGPPTLQIEDAMHRNPAFSIRSRTLHKLYNGCPESGSGPSSSKKKNFSNARELVKFKENVYQSRSVFRVGSLISQRRPVTEEEVGRTLERAMSFKSEHPFTIAVMQDSYVYTSFSMCVPAWFVKEHLPKENTVMTVWDPSGKPWKITYIFHSTHASLSSGWGKFSCANNLEKYDACVFELIQKDHLKVHIYRVVEETTPLIRRRRCHANN